MPKPRTEPETIEKIRELAAQGFTPSQIKTQLGVGFATAKKYAEGVEVAEEQEPAEEQPRQPRRATREEWQELANARETIAGMEAREAELMQHIVELSMENARLRRLAGGQG